MKIKINKSKFVRNIFICIIALIIVAFIINIAPGYKRDQYSDVINLIINEENRTEELKNDIYVNENGTVYMSEEDVRNFFDSTLYYDEKYNQIITSSNTKVACISVDKKQITINSSINTILDPIIKIDNVIYLPVSNLSIVYNIKIDYIQNTSRVIIDELNKGMIKATVSEKTSIKFKPRGLSKNVGTLSEGEIVACFYTTSKGWRQVRTSDGTIGYVKANKLSNEYIVRQDMLEREEATVISIFNYDNKIFELLGSSGTNEKIVLKSVLNINGDIIENIKDDDINFKTYKTWFVISNKDFEDETNKTLQDYTTRTDLIDSIVSKAIEEEINGISIEWNNMQDEESMIRFIIELAPRLRELGINTCLVLNDNMNKQDYINIVDYIVE